jgi:hypothetical protein
MSVFVGSVDVHAISADVSDIKYGISLSPDEGKDAWKKAMPNVPTSLYGGFSYPSDDQYVPSWTVLELTVNFMPDELNTI